MFLLILYLSIAVLVSFLCSVLEAALLSITPSFVNIKISQGKKVGRDLQKLKENIDKPLSAILTLNTFANTFGAAGVGAQAQLLWGNEYLTIASISLTLTILFFSEIIPKTIGAVYWKPLAGFTAGILKVMVFTLFPVVWISNKITSFFKDDTNQSVLSRADFKAMTEIGIKEGLFKEDESAMLRNLLNYYSVQVKDVMTPRTVVIAEPEEVTLSAFMEKYPDLRFSRIPIYNKQIDSLTGFVLKDDILMEMIHQGDQKKLRDLKRSIDVIPEVAPIPKLFKLFLDKSAQIAMVIDEHGGMAGIVTMEDIIETILGLEITDELDNVEDLQALARNNWEKRAKKLGLLE